jgi:hypothetical protein
LRSFVASCELVKVDPFGWFHDVLSLIAAHPATRLESGIVQQRGGELDASGGAGAQELAARGQ